MKQTSLIRSITSLAAVAVFGVAGSAFATGSGSGSGSGSSSASDGAAGSASASAPAGDAAAGSGASGPGDGSASSAGPSTPTRFACFDRSVVAWRNTPECTQFASEPIPADWANDPRFNECPSQAVDAGSPPRRY